MLKSNDDLTICIVGHCDQLGSNKYNDSLGMKRAKKVMKSLRLDGVPSDKITSVKSMGKRKPICDEMDENCRKFNRRAEIYFQ
ncbi:MAG: hypothetical protein OHK0040_00960 [bacterium]